MMRESMAWILTARIVTAVSTRLATASIRLANRSKFRLSFFFLIAFEAYILAPSVFPCWRACAIDPRLATLCRYANSSKRTVSNLFQFRLFRPLVLKSLCWLLWESLGSELWRNHQSASSLQGILWLTLSWNSVSREYLLALIKWGMYWRTLEVTHRTVVSALGSSLGHVHNHPTIRRNRNTESRYCLWKYSFSKSHISSGSYFNPWSESSRNIFQSLRSMGLLYILSYFAAIVAFIFVVLSLGMWSNFSCHRLSLS